MKAFIWAVTAVSAAKALLYFVLVCGYNKYPRMPSYGRESDGLSFLFCVGWAFWGIFVLWRKP